MRGACCLFLHSLLRRGLLPAQKLIAAGGQCTGKGIGQRRQRGHNARLCLTEGIVKLLRGDVCRMQQRLQRLHGGGGFEQAQHEQLGKAFPGIFFPLRTIHQTALDVIVHHGGGHGTLLAVINPGKAAVGVGHDLIHIQAEIGKLLPFGEHGALQALLIILQGHGRTPPIQ